MESAEDDTCEELACDAQEADVTVVIAVAPVTPVLIPGDNIGVSCLVALLLHPSTSRGVHEAECLWH